MALVAPSQARRVLMESSGGLPGPPPLREPGLPFAQRGQGAPSWGEESSGPLPAITAPHSMQRGDVPGGPPWPFSHRRPVRGGRSAHRLGSHTDLGWGPSCSA